jgi:DNA-binding transcriptional LysR family regulator
MAKRLGLTQPAVGYAVDRGEQAVKEMKIELLE